MMKTGWGDGVWGRDRGRSQRWQGELDNRRMKERTNMG